MANSKESALLGDSSRVGSMKYKETQIHGEVCFDQHVERLVANTKHRGTAIGDRIVSVARKHDWAFSWMDEEQRRMRAEDMHKLGGEAWAERLKAVMESGGDGDVEVPEGFCKVGCGRPVCPGTTRAGRPFTTCCRGCVMGFGHDLRCGTIDASKVGPGLCKNGCGRAVAPGKDSKGRALTTCCRGCALGLDHDDTCGKSVAKSDSVRLCKTGCGRSVAPGTTKSGKPFDTCCRGCAKGEDHTGECEARAASVGGGAVLLMRAMSSTKDAS